MKKLSILLVSIFAMAMASAESKIGYVDVAYVMAKSPQRVAITEQLKGEFKEQEEEIKKLMGDYQKMMEKAQKDGATMSEKERVDLTRDAQELETKIKLKQKAIQEDSQRRGGEEQRKLELKVVSIVQDIAKEEKYDMIINKGALLWATPGTNISEKVLAKLSSSTN